ncbi:M14 family zinc carboxypeptidase [Streptomyces sp. A012304]|uniref:M14 family zinc carboxypeptidase n=1 Tax=Streptomyces sp. A012304 TaxID=375446 RepID=UPI002231CF35|nr:M14 family zinc carboxypeptidase [Streptomyces sp. A012304]
MPRPDEVIGAGPTDRLYSLEETWRYLDAAEATGDRVSTGVLDPSWSGGGLRYAVVGSPHLVTPKGLAAVRRRLRLLRDPRTTRADLLAAVHDTPAVAWLGAGTHGNEPAGTNAALWLLHDLADRSDAAVERVLRHILVFVLPVQNPDGFSAGHRNNGYGFDLNRDWFAATQRETRGKLALLQQYPPVLFMDLHEMTGDSYFFPPYADPVHHEIPVFAQEEVEDYNRGLAAEFARAGADHFSGTGFDLLYPGFADASVQLSTLTAGMTFEKGLAATLHERVTEHHHAPWQCLSQLASRRKHVLREWHLAHVEAYRQGRRGELQPRRRATTVDTPPIPDQPVRHYFLLPEPQRTFETARLVHRLQLAGVEVHVLTAELEVLDFRPYGDPPYTATLPAGTYWVPMAQARKHWVQAMLGESSHPSTGVFTDVGAWSLPLLGNVRGGRSGARLRPVAVPAPPVAAPEVTATHPPAPRIGLLRLLPESSQVAGPYGWTLHQLDNVWRYPHADLRPGDISQETLRDVSVLVVPDGPAGPANERLGEAGRAALRDWVEAGGRYVGWRGAVLLAALVGLTTAGFVVPEAQIPGAFVRTRAHPSGPLTEGAGEHVWQFYFDDLVLYPTDPAHRVLSYPEADSPDWFVAGHALGAEALAGTASVIEEPVGSGSVVLFGSDPNFRGMADGTARILRNAITQRRRRENPVPPSRAREAPTARALQATRAAGELRSEDRPRPRVVVRDTDLATTRAVLRSVGVRWREHRSAGWATLMIDSQYAVAAGHRPWARSLPALLEARKVRPLMVVI